MIQQDHVPGRVVQDGVQVSVAVVDESIEHHHLRDLRVPVLLVCSIRGLIPLERRDVLDPLGRRPLEALQHPFNRGRNHVQGQQLVELVGRDVGLIAVLEAPRRSRQQRLPSQTGDGPPGWKHAAHRKSGLAEVLQPVTFGRSQLLLDFEMTSQPRPGVGFPETTWTALQAARKNRERGQARQNKRSGMRPQHSDLPVAEYRPRPAPRPLAILTKL